MLGLLKKTLKEKKFQNKVKELRTAIKINEAEWERGKYFKERWNKEWNEKFPTLEEALLENINSQSSAEAIENAIEIVNENLFLLYEEINEKKKMAWIEEIINTGKEANAKAVVIRRKDIEPEKEDSMKKFKESIEKKEMAQIVLSGVFAFYVTFPIDKELNPKIIEYWGVSEKTCSVEYVS